MGIATMATTSKTVLAKENTGLLNIPQTDEAAAKASELLQHNHETKHIFFNEKGYHNHVVHHLLALYGTGAPVSSLNHAHEINETYQRPIPPINEGVVKELGNWETARQYLGNAQQYHNWLAFFKYEIDTKGVEGTLLEHVFKGDERADDLLVRLHGGLLHPLIHLMYALEFSQPVILAEALSQAAVHKPILKDFLMLTEGLTKAESTKMPTIVSLLEDIRKDEKLANSVVWDDDQKITDGVLTRARDEMMAIASKVQVSESDLEETTAAMIDAALYIALGASAGGKKWGFDGFSVDFLFLHHVNVLPIYITLNKLSWLPTSAKVRMLEWKIRLDLLQYAARGVPELSLDHLVAYVPDSKSALPNGAIAGSPSDLFNRLFDFDDDGHAIKLGRALEIARELDQRCATEGLWGNRPWAMLKGDNIWARSMHMVVDSVTSSGEGRRWVRSAGFKEAWEEKYKDTK